MKFERLPESQIKIEVTISAQDMLKYKDIALQQFGEKMAVGGFRKGKAPINIIEEEVDKTKLILEVVDIAVNESYYQTVISNKDDILTIGTPQIDFKGKIGENILTDGMEYEATVDVYPLVTIPDYAKIKIKAEKILVTEEEVKAEIDNLRSKRASLENVDEEYLSCDGDWLEVDFKVEVDTNELADAGAKSFPLILGKHSLVPGFEEQLIGLKKNSEKKFSLDLPGDFRDKRMAGKKVDFLVKINEIKKVVLPNIDEQFVSSLKIDGITNESELTNFISDNIKKEKEVHEKDHVRNNILETIEKDTKMELPKSLIQREIQIMWHELEENLKKQGIGLDDYLEKENLKKDSIEDGWHEHAVKRAKIGIIINELIKKEQIKVEGVEIDENIAQQMNNLDNYLKSQNSDNSTEIRKKYEKDYSNEENRKQIEQYLTLEKMFTKLENVIIDNS